MPCSGKVDMVLVGYIIHVVLLLGRRAGAGPAGKRRQGARGTVLNTCMMLVEPQASSPIVISPVPVAAILGACVFAIDTYPSTP